MTDLSGMLRGATGDGVHWALDGSADLNVSLVHLDAGHGIGDHVNDEVDVVLVVLAGEGRLTVDGAGTALTPHVVAHVPRGARRGVRAAAGRGVDYLSIHRRRGPLTVGPARAGGVAGRAARESDEAGREADEGGDPACWAHLVDDEGGERGAEGGTRY